MLYHDETSTGTYRLLGVTGSGGEGAVYDVEGYPEAVAKLYNPDRLERRITDPMTGRQWNMLGKVTHMAHSGLSPWVIEDGEPVLAIAWPQVPLFDEGHNFVGFLMPRVASARHDESPANLHVAYRERERKYLFGDGYTWLTSVKIAMNLASVVRYLHENGVVIGDFNCNNILIDRDAHVMLIDTDSFCIPNAVLGVTYRCVVGVGEFIAPELQGQRLDDPHSKRVFTRESDCFSLAIHIFELLMGGVHPFAGRSPSQSRSSSSVEPYVREIVSGACPYVTGSKLAPIPGSMPMSMLPDWMRVMFDRVFSYDAQTALRPETIRRRPTAAEWEAALDRLYRECLASPKHCPVDARHKCHPSNDMCPWCARDGMVTPLQSVLPNKRSGAGRHLALGLGVGVVAVASVAAILLATGVIPPAGELQSDVNDSTAVLQEAEQNEQNDAGKITSPIRQELTSGAFALDFKNFQLQRSTLEHLMQAGWRISGIRSASMTNPADWTIQPADIDVAKTVEDPDSVLLKPSYVYHEFVLTHSTSKAKISVALQNTQSVPQPCTQCMVALVATTGANIQLPKNGYIGMPESMLTQTYDQPQFEEDCWYAYWHDTRDEEIPVSTHIYSYACDSNQYMSSMTAYIQDGMCTGIAFGRVVK